MTEIRGQRTVGKGGIIGQLSVQRCARQTKDENEPSKEIVAGQFAGPSIEHRTSLIFSLNLAQRIERGISNPFLQSFEPDFFNRTSLKATANVYTFNGTPDLDLSQSDTPHLTTLDP
jgi:hypothetical protein